MMKGEGRRHLVTESSEPWWRHTWVIDPGLPSVIAPFLGAKTSRKKIKNHDKHASMHWSFLTVMMTMSRKMKNTLRCTSSINSFVAKAYICLGERCARILGHTDGLKWNLRAIELSFNYKYAKTVTHTVLLKFSSHWNIKKKENVKIHYQATQYLFFYDSTILLFSLFSASFLFTYLSIAMYSRLATFRSDNSWYLTIVINTHCMFRRVNCVPPLSYPNNVLVARVMWSSTWTLSQVSAELEDTIDSCETFKCIKSRFLRC